MEFTEENLQQAMARMDLLIDALLAELNCDDERYILLCGEFGEATAQAQMLLEEQANRHADRRPAELTAMYQEAVRLYDTHMSGFTMALSSRRRRFGLGG